MTYYSYNYSGTLGADLKVSWFTGFHPNVGKTFAVFALSVLKVLPLLEAFVGKTAKIRETLIFSYIGYVVYGTS